MLLHQTFFIFWINKQTFFFFSLLSALLKILFLLPFPQSSNSKNATPLVVQYEEKVFEFLGFEKSKVCLLEVRPHYIVLAFICCLKFGIIGEWTRLMFCLMIVPSSCFDIAIGLNFLLLLVLWAVVNDACFITVSERNRIMNNLYASLYML